MNHVNQTGSKQLRCTYIMEVYMITVTCMKAQYKTEYKTGPLLKLTEDKDFTNEPDV